MLKDWIQIIIWNYISPSLSSPSTSSPLSSSLFLCLSSFRQVFLSHLTKLNKEYTKVEGPGRNFFIQARGAKILILNWDQFQVKNPPHLQPLPVFHSLRRLPTLVLHCASATHSLSPPMTTLDPLLHAEVFPLTSVGQCAGRTTIAIVCVQLENQFQRHRHKIVNLVKLIRGKNR